jgi:TatD DNase family protein
VLDMGWYLSFTGVVTFKNARRAPEVLEKMPADRIMLETDCPYMAPEPKRGRRNSSLLLPYIAEKVAEVRGISTEEIAAITKENGKRFFGISCESLLIREEIIFKRENNNDTEKIVARSNI